MILCHTPIRGLKKEFEEKFVLVSGTGNILEICQDYGFKKVLHVDEVYAM